MGLDQYGFAIDSAGKKIEISYWRKHPNLQGWMEALWNQKRKNPKNLKQFARILEENEPQEEFNCVDLELELEDLQQLEKDVKFNKLPQTIGFFYGGNSDDHYKLDDLKFIEEAKNYINSGCRVYYSSWW